MRIGTPSVRTQTPRSGGRSLPHAVQRRLSLLVLSGVILAFQAGVTGSVADEMAAARRRLDRAFDDLQKQFAADMKGKKLAAAAAKTKPAGEDGRAAAERLENRAGALGKDLSAEEFAALTNAMQQVSRSVGGKDAAETLYWDLQKLDVDIRNAVEREIRGTLRRMQNRRPVKSPPGMRHR